jgi:hypothetical protein
LCDLNTVAVSTSAPATSAPATSAPETSASSTSAPATSAPLTLLERKRKPPPQSKETLSASPPKKPARSRHYKPCARCSCMSADNVYFALPEAEYITPARKNNSIAFCNDCVKIVAGKHNKGEHRLLKFKCVNEDEKTLLFCTNTHKARPITGKAIGYLGAFSTDPKSGELWLTLPSGEKRQVTKNRCPPKGVCTIRCPPKGVCTILESSVSQKTSTAGESHSHADQSSVFTDTGSDTESDDGNSRVPV